LRILLDSWLIDSSAEEPSLRISEWIAHQWEKGLDSVDYGGAIQALIEGKKPLEDIRP
jgi:hypothetical protein